MRGVVALEEADLVADRARLRKLLYEHPAWPRQEYADLIGRSPGWVKKWMKRLREAAPTDEAVLWSRSSARKHPPPRTSPEAIECILEIRDDPPENLQRTPGPQAIRYSPPPRSVAPVFRLPRPALDAHESFRSSPSMGALPTSRAVSGCQWSAPDRWRIGNWTGSGCFHGAA
jgi:hypothetical protein